ncbi:hypothetical protein NOR51B_2065 [Luminiphilus syltensis NOR5-1B]|uniref:Uncharacterized protein n=2 Tax=Luminiphilus TaxID=1341118 RepID=B8KT25_9GAMM|nr:hypothetical protein NOR51B_2065 [Luminiphilus syltensis NOR5-1B]
MKAKESGRSFGERMQFRMLLSVVFLYFFVGAVMGRMFPGQSVQASQATCYEHARQSAYSVVPYIYMRV